MDKAIEKANKYLQKNNIAVPILSVKINKTIDKALDIVVAEKNKEIRKLGESYIKDLNRLKNVILMYEEKIRKLRNKRNGGDIND